MGSIFLCGIEESAVSWGGASPIRLCILSCINLKRASCQSFIIAWMSRGAVNVEVAAGRDATSDWEGAGRGPGPEEADGGGTGIWSPEARPGWGWGYAGPAARVRDAGRGGKNILAKREGVGRWCLDRWSCHQLRRRRSRWSAHRALEDVQSSSSIWLRGTGWSRCLLRSEMAGPPLGHEHADRGGT